MKILYRITILFFVAFTAFNKATSQTMFRGAADHNSHYNSGIKGIFNEQAWKLDADAPIRSTVVVANNAVYFGSSKGVFYCLNKINSKINWTFKPGYAINSSAAYHNGNVFFSDNQQSIYSLN